MKSIRKNNFNTTSIVDGQVGNANISNHFHHKFSSLFNNVKTSKKSLDVLYGCIDAKCNDTCIYNNHGVENNMHHCHVIDMYDVKNAVKKLKSDKIDVDGNFMSNNLIHGTDMLFKYLSHLFTCMITHGFAPTSFLQSTMIPIPKGARADLTDSDMYRSIAISSLLSKILDNIIIDEQCASLSTSNYQFGFKANSSTVLCSTMVIETIQYYLENNRQSV